MKKFTIHGVVGEHDSPLFVHLAAENQEVAYAVANQIYSGGWDMFEGWLVDCDKSAHIDNPAVFYDLVKKSMDKPDKFPHMVAGRVMRQRYIRWYAENADVIRLMYLGMVQECTPTDIELMNARSELQRLRGQVPSVITHPHPEVPNLPVQKMDWDGLREEVMADGGVRNESLMAVMPGDGFHGGTVSKLASTSAGIYPLRELSLGEPSLETDQCYPAFSIEQARKERFEQKSDGTASAGMQDPPIIIAKELPESFGLYRAVELVKDGISHGQYRFEVHMDSWESIIHVCDFATGLARFFEQYPREVLMVDDYQTAAWFEDRQDSGYFTMHAMSYKGPPSFTDEQVIEFYKHKDYYRQYARMIKQFKETLK